MKNSSATVVPLISVSLGRRAADALRSTNVSNRIASDAEPFSALLGRLAGDAIRFSAPPERPASVVIASGEPFS